ncbi:MAG: hypothetical protein IME98_05355, partial [Proteobacteria bacterium]|nr:hypothetical protein [Pseudomonadota bacterium]
MDKVLNKVTRISAFAIMALFLFAATGKSAHGDVLFIGDRAGAGDEVTIDSAALNSEPEELNQFLDVLLADDESVYEENAPKAENPVAVLSTSVKERLSGIASLVDISLRDITSTASN